MEEQILELIRQIGNNGEEIGVEDELWDSGVLDSLAFIMLLDEISDRWGVEIQPTQVPLKRWENVRSIAKLVEEAAGYPK
ncbi:MAG: acyl carrier protein [Oscillospiraceae bacterium]|nr:acyl carrier protein [Oscillospiraceae bacterium]